MMPTPNDFYWREYGPALHSHTRSPLPRAGPCAAACPFASGAYSTAAATMPFKRYVEIGRVALINFGEDYGKLVVISDVVDQNKVSSGLRSMAVASLSPGLQHHAAGGG